MSTKMQWAAFALPFFLLGVSLPHSVNAQESDEVQDMSDPMAVYTQAGAGLSNEGLNLKIGHAYDTGNPDTMAMNLIELKGFLGGTLGLDGNDSVNTFRYRHFSLDTTTGRGAQIDINWNFNNDMGSASYSFIQALPEMGVVQFYPLAGVGITVRDTGKIVDQKDPDFGSVGYAIPSSFAVIGTYTAIEISEKVWLNYNPMYVKTINNNTRMSDLSDGFHHELAVSYQLNPRQNVRWFANYYDTEVNAENDWDWRLEFNHQF